MKFKPADWIHLLCTLVGALIHFKISYVIKFFSFQKITKMTTRFFPLLICFEYDHEIIMNTYQGISYFSSIHKIGSNRFK